MSLFRPVSVRTEQTYLIAHFMDNVLKTAIQNEANTLPTIAGKKMAHVRARLQSAVAAKFLKSIEFSNYHGFVSDLTRYVHDRVDMITRSESRLHDINELNSLFYMHSLNRAHVRFAFKIEGVKSLFAVDTGVNGVLIYQISTNGNVDTGGLSGYIEDIFQVDWDVENPTNLDSWLSIVRGRTIPTKYSLVCYLSGIGLKRTDHLVDYTKFEEHFCREIIRLGLKDTNETVRYALGMRNEFIGIHPDSLARFNRGLNNFMDSMNYSDIGKDFQIGQIYEAIEFLLKENAPVLTEVAFFEQWEHRSEFKRLDAIVVGLRENMMSYVYNVKGTDQYLWIDIVNKQNISAVNILRDKDIAYLGLAFTKIDDVGVQVFMDTHGFAVEQDYDK